MNTRSSNQDVTREDQDSTLVKFVREGENTLGRVRQDVATRRTLGVGLLILAALLFIPPWFLIPGLVFAGFSLLGVNPFWFGSCGSSRRSSTEGSSHKESIPL